MFEGDNAHPLPVVVVSRCLGFAKCRYNGQALSNPIVEKLEGFVNFIDVCPEADIGLGIPREPIRMVEGDSGKILVQPATGKDCTKDMQDYAEEFLEGLDEVDGFILKYRSPSCGLKDVRIYHDSPNPAVKSKGAGMFAEKVLEKYPGKAVEDDGRIRNARIREDYLTRLFMIARLRKVESMGGLVEFHGQHKYILMSYSQKELNKLGNIVANRGKKEFREVKKDYESSLAQALEKPPTTSSYINVLDHLMGYFKKQLSGDEKRLFKNKLEEFRDERIPLSTAISIIESWNSRFQDRYLEKQRIFNPYPKQLVEIDSLCPI